MSRIIAIALYPNFTVLDAIGPYEVLTTLPDTRVVFVAAQPGPVYADTGELALVASAGSADLPHPDVLVIPGGGVTAAMADAALIDWISTAHATTTYTMSVCTGAFLLGAAGLLHGLTVTTYWAALPHLSQIGAVGSAARFVVNDRIITAAGVSAGIDAALWLARALTDEPTARAIARAVEYDPQPPFTTTSDEATDALALALLDQRSAKATG